MRIRHCSSVVFSSDLVKLPRLRGRDADIPQGAPAAVLGPDLLAPQAVEPHEVAEALRLAVPGLLHNASIGGGKRIGFRSHLAAYLVHQDQRARIVVHAKDMVTVSNAIQDVMQN